jgi:hypothetical protein
VSESTEVDTVSVPGFPWPTWRERPYAEIEPHQFLWAAWIVLVLFAQLVGLVFEVIGVIVFLRWLY